MKWLVILGVGALVLLFAIDPPDPNPPDTLTYYVHLEEGEERRDIDFGVIESISTTSSSTTLTTVVSPSTTTTTHPKAGSSTTLTTTALTSTTKATDTGSGGTTTTTSSGTSTTAPTTTPTTRDKTVLAGLLIAALSYWLWQRRPRE